MTARLPPPSATVMNVKNAASPGHEKISNQAHLGWDAVSVGPPLLLDIPTGANKNWSKATLRKALKVPLPSPMGKILLRKPNHLCWIGAIMKPYAMNLVNRSKSNGGGPRLDAGVR